MLVACLWTGNFEVLLGWKGSCIVAGRPRFYKKKLARFVGRAFVLTVAGGGPRFESWRALWAALCPKYHCSWWAAFLSKLARLSGPRLLSQVPL